MGTAQEHNDSDLGTAEHVVERQGTAWYTRRFGKWITFRHQEHSDRRSTGCISAGVIVCFGSDTSMDDVRGGSVSPPLREDHTARRGAMPITSHVIRMYL
jgi:hypothetical protein